MSSFTAILQPLYNLLATLRQPLATEPQLCNRVATMQPSHDWVTTGSQPSQYLGQRHSSTPSQCQIETCTHATEILPISKLRLRFKAVLQSIEARPMRQTALRTILSRSAIKRRSLQYTLSLSISCSERAKRGRCLASGFFFAPAR